MKKFFVGLLLSVTSILSFSQATTEKTIPVTTKSKEALAFYYQGMKYFDDVALDKASETFLKALKEDPDFFMANFQMSLYYSGQGDFEKFSEYADQAINCRAELSQAEELLKSALKELRKGEGSDVTGIGKKLVDMYPNDINSYNYLFYFQSFVSDYEGELETLTKALKITSNKAPVYNQLGYVYLSLKQNDKAEECFDKYIELDPKNPNVYDSKGDYFMVTKDYKKAYESYMKAYVMDTSWSIDKARRAKQLYENTEGKKLDIITM